MAASRIFRADRLGLTGTWYEVPKTKELPAHSGLAAWEVRGYLKRHKDILIEKNQKEGRQRKRLQARENGES